MVAVEEVNFAAPNRFPIILEDTTGVAGVRIPAPIEAVANSFGGKVINQGVLPDDIFLVAAAGAISATPFSDGDTFTLILKEAKVLVPDSRHIGGETAVEEIRLRINVRTVNMGRVNDLVIG